MFLLGYPGMGKRTIGGALATLIEAVLLDNARTHGVLLEPFRWDGVGRRRDGRRRCPPDRSRSARRSRKKHVWIEKVDGIEGFLDGAK